MVHWVRVYGTITYSPIESPCQVVKKYAVFKNIWKILKWYLIQKIPKTVLKYVFLEGVLKNRFYEINLAAKYNFAIYFLSNGPIWLSIDWFIDILRSGSNLSRKMRFWTILEPVLNKILRILRRIKFQKSGLIWQVSSFAERPKVTIHFSVIINLFAFLPFFLPLWVKKLVMER